MLLKYVIKNIFKDLETVLKVWRGPLMFMVSLSYDSKIAFFMLTLMW